MSQVIQKQGMAALNYRHRPASSLWPVSRGLFSSALFCLWLSSASLMVWVDFGRSPAEQVAAARTASARTAPAGVAASTDAIKHH